MKKILFIGESWMIHMIHAKGFDTFESTKYEEGASYLIECLEKEGFDVDYLPSHEVQVRFPKSLVELEDYDAVVLSDIGSNTFLLQNSTFYDLEVKTNALSLIKEYVSEGGGFMMIGGYLSFMGIEGKANYKNTVLEEIFPIEMKDSDDRVECPEGTNPVTISDHEITRNLKEWPKFLGYNQFKPKNNALVLAEINKDPLLVLGKYNEGKTACFASDCAPHWGSKEFLDWDDYSEFWSRVINHVTS